MSRIGKKPIPLPKGVDVTINNGSVTVKGPKGSLTRKIHPAVNVHVSDGQVVCAAETDRTSKELWGLTRVLIENMVTGVSAGYRRVLDIQGVGYKVEVKGKELAIAVGLSHPVIFTAPEGIALKTETATRIVIEGSDKELVGRLASQMRKVRPPEPYKAKGIHYLGEYIRRKVGKAAGK